MPKQKQKRPAAPADTLPRILRDETIGRVYLKYLASTSLAPAAEAVEQCEPPIPPPRTRKIRVCVPLPAEEKISEKPVLFQLPVLEHVKGRGKFFETLRSQAQDISKHRNTVSHKPQTVAQDQPEGDKTHQRPSTVCCEPNTAGKKQLEAHETHQPSDPAEATTQLRANKIHQRSSDACQNTKSVAKTQPSDCKGPRGTAFSVAFAIRKPQKHPTLQIIIPTIQRRRRRSSKARKQIPLPEHILSRIFSYVSAPRVFGLVCRAFYEVSRSPPARAALFINHAHGPEYAIPFALFGQWHNACYLAVLEVLLRTCPLPRWVVQIAVISRDMQRVAAHVGDRKELLGIPRSKLQAFSLAKESRDSQPQQQQAGQHRRVPRGPAWMTAWTAGTLDKLISRGREQYGAPAIRGRDWEAMRTLLAEVRTRETEPEVAAKKIRTLLSEYGYRPWRIIAGPKPPELQELDVPAVRASLAYNLRDADDFPPPPPLSSISAATNSMSETFTSIDSSGDSNSSHDGDSTSEFHTHTPDGDYTYDDAADDTVLMNYDPHHDRYLKGVPPSRVNALYGGDLLEVYSIDNSLVWELATPFTADHIRAILARRRRLSPTLFKTEPV
ncbi:hypothetical protein HDU87_006834 [Geranomyces variabilis]|uniref:F-box domain-containing protein n=1 Tax=Geranomyces variabilis TaxID=109894 RepID=A0AAD5TS30_9FUNG|nr:hypothetical protein HDU87_006834 [Geranomyces variabilis]